LESVLVTLPLKVLNLSRLQSLDLPLVGRVQATAADVKMTPYLGEVDMISKLDTSNINMQLLSTGDDNSGFIVRGSVRASRMALANKGAVQGCCLFAATRERTPSHECGASKSTLPLCCICLLPNVNPCHVSTRSWCMPDVALDTCYMFDQLLWADTSFHVFMCQQQAMADYRCQLGSTWQPFVMKVHYMQSSGVVAPEVEVQSTYALRAMLTHKSAAERVVAAGASVRTNTKLYRVDTVNGPHLMVLGAQMTENPGGQLTFMEQSSKCPFKFNVLVEEKRTASHESIHAIVREQIASVTSR
jgi:hypothetical protein